MNISRIKVLLIASVILPYTTVAFGHTAGEHGGSLLQQVLHILQSADHLFIILAVGIVISLLVNFAKNNQDE